jgi:hypothetical protein
MKAFNSTVCQQLKYTHGLQLSIIFNLSSLVIVSVNITRNSLLKFFI